MRINNNLMAMNTHRQLGAAGANGARSMEKLSSGLRINKAGDDAAGLSISEKMRGQIRGLNQASRNAQDGISLIQTAEGALQETHAILQRMRELAVQGANDTNVSVDRQAIKNELDQLSEEVDRIANTTEFNKQTLLSGTFGVERSATAANNNLAVSLAGVTAVEFTGMKESTQITLTVAGNVVTATEAGATGSVQKIDMGAATGVTGTLNFDQLGLSISLEGAALSVLNDTKIETGAQASRQLQIGANENQKLSIKINDMTSSGLVVQKADLDVTDYAAAQGTLTKVENAIALVSKERSNLGAWQNRLEHTIKNLDTSSENLQASESRIRDVDMAKEMMEFTKNNILQQAAQAMLAQANQQPQGVLQLLR